MLSGAVKHSGTRGLLVWGAGGRTALWTAILICAVIGGLLFVMDQTYSARARGAAHLAHALRVKTDVEELTAAHFAANVAFVRGLSAPYLEARVWPIARVVAVARYYDDLAVAFRRDPGKLAAVRALRLASSHWAAQLDAVRGDTLRSGRFIGISTASLIPANETLMHIASGLASLRNDEDAYLGQNTSASARRLQAERTGLAVAALVAMVLLAYGFAVNHRAGLARARVRFGAEQGEARFREFFERHPLAMLIYDWRTLEFLAVNDAAISQYGYSQHEFMRMGIEDIRPAEDLNAFREKRNQLVAEAHPAYSGSAGVWCHRRKNHSTLWVRVSFHFLEFAGRQACFIVASDVTEQIASEAAMLASKQMLETVLDTVPQGIFWKDLESRYLGCNKAFAKEIGLDDPASIVGRRDQDMPWHEMAEQMRQIDAGVLASGTGLYSYEEYAHIKPGVYAHLLKSKVPLVDGRGQIFGILTTYENISKRKAAELALHLRSRALEASVNAVLITRKAQTGSVIEYANPAFQNMTGYNVTRGSKLEPGDGQTGEILAQIGTALREQEVTTVLESHTRAGRMFWTQFHVAPVPDESGTVTHHITVLNDVTELIASRDQLEKQAKFDALTSLPNRILLGERLKGAIAWAAATHTRVALIFMDIDHFKDINDSLGHRAGDRLLGEIGTRLKRVMQSGETVARYGGDEFVFVVPVPHGGNRVEEVLAIVSRALAQPIKIDEHDLYIEGSAGVSYYPEDGSDGDALMKKADMAMYDAKSRGRNVARRYVSEMGRQSDSRLALSGRLRQALRNQEFVLFYQPQVDLRQHRITGVEALLRWNDPENGLVSPASFIPLAEENGLIAPIGAWVLREACRQAKRWRDEGLPEFLLSVNLSPRQVSRGDIVALVAECLKASGLPPHALELEITEGTLMVQSSVAMLHRLRAMGVRIAIDDFGTGYSSLTYLKNIKADRLKLDRSFVKDLGTGAGRADEAIALAVLALGHTLDLKVTAEGVETHAQWTFLRDNGCDEMQGFLFAAPIPAAEVAALVRSKTELAAAGAFDDFWTAPRRVV